MLWAVAAFGPLLMSLLMVIWWLSASRARWMERGLGFIGIAITFGVALMALDSTMMGPAITVYMIPVGMALFGLIAILCSRMLSMKRTWIAVLFAGLGFGSAALLRADGMWGNYAMGLHWRWELTSEEKIAARQQASTAGEGASESSGEANAQWLANPQWPGLRGSDGASRVRGVSLEDDWTANPPKQLWKSVVGPAWSSFAVAGERLFTQEQRGENECVVCYSAIDGKEVWVSQIKSRFDDPLGGPGPRATPTIADGKLFTMGGQGWVQCLNAIDGTVLWSKDVRDIAIVDPRYGVLPHRRWSSGKRLSCMQAAQAIKVCWLSIRIQAS